MPAAQNAVDGKSLCYGIEANGQGRDACNLCSTCCTARESIAVDGGRVGGRVAIGEVEIECELFGIFARHFEAGQIVFQL